MDGWSEAWAEYSSARELDHFAALAASPPRPLGRGESSFRRVAKWALLAHMAMTTTPSGLQYEDTREGQGASPTKGQTCVMHYTGWLWVDGKKGEKFDSSV